MRRLFPLLLLLTCVVSALAEPHWEVQYRYRNIETTLTINDFVFPSAKRGIACGFTTDRNEKDRPLVLASADAGVTWAEVSVKEACISLFFLDDSTGWMVTDKGLWTTSESGRTWRKMKLAPTGMLRVHFLDARHGFLAGREKRVFETLNGGESWAPLEILKQVKGDPLFTTFGEISFNGPRGLISGWNIPPRRGGPAWMSPETASQRRQIPNYSVLLETNDAGKHWLISESSIFGQITRISMDTKIALGLIEFKDEFEYPSEVLALNQRTGKSDRAFRQKDRAITDVRLFAGGERAMIAGYETQGSVFRSPIPGKLRILTSTDLATWTEMPVDYRAVAHSALLSGPDEKNVWAATDTGMILRLVD